MSVADRLHELGMALPELPVPAYDYLSARRHGAVVYTSGHTPTANGSLAFRGKLGAEITIEQGQAAARICVLNCLGAVSALIGDLERVKVLKLTGYVASAPGFDDQPTVINGASNLLTQILGEAGQHARSALGVAELPGGAPVEVELVVALC